MSATVFPESQDNPYRDDDLDDDLDDDPEPSFEERKLQIFLAMFDKAATAHAKGGRCEIVYNVNDPMACAAFLIQNKDGRYQGLERSGVSYGLGFTFGKGIEKTETPGLMHLVEDGLIEVAGIQGEYTHFHFTEKGAEKSVEISSMRLDDARRFKEMLRQSRENDFLPQHRSSPEERMKRYDKILEAMMRSHAEVLAFKESICARSDFENGPTP